MTTEFILMTIGSIILIIVAILQKRRIKELSEKYHDLYDKGWEEYNGYGKVYRRKYRYIVIGMAGDNVTLNQTAMKYYGEGFDLDREKSTDRLLVFVKSVEVEPGFKDL